MFIIFFFFKCIQTYHRNIFYSFLLRLICDLTRRDKFLIDAKCSVLSLDPVQEIDVFAPLSVGEL